MKIVRRGGVITATLDDGREVTVEDGAPLTESGLVGPIGALTRELIFRKAKAQEAKEQQNDNPTGMAR